MENNYPSVEIKRDYCSSASSAKCGEKGRILCFRSAYSIYDKLVIHAVVALEDKSIISIPLDYLEIIDHGVEE